MRPALDPASSSSAAQPHGGLRAQHPGIARLASQAPIDSSALSSAAHVAGRQRWPTGTEPGNLQRAAQAASWSYERVAADLVQVTHSSRLDRPSNVFTVSVGLIQLIQGRFSEMPTGRQRDESIREVATWLSRHHRIQVEMAPVIARAFHEFDLDACESTFPRAETPPEIDAMNGIEFQEAAMPPSAAGTKRRRSLVDEENASAAEDSTAHGAEPAHCGTQPEETSAPVVEDPLKDVFIPERTRQRLQAAAKDSDRERLTGIVERVFFDEEARTKHALVEHFMAEAQGQPR
jgi:hypothetical protein